MSVKFHSPSILRPHHRPHPLKLGFLFVLMMLVAACGASELKFAALPAGNASRGQSLFASSVQGAPACTTCHSAGKENMTGPGLAGFGSVAGTRISGLSAGDYALQSILQPATYIREGFANAMFTQYGQYLSKDQQADLIAYLLSL